MNGILSFARKHRSVITSTVTSIVSVLLAICSTEIYKALVATIKSDEVTQVKFFIAGTLIAGTILLFFVFSFLAEKAKAKIWPDDIDDVYMKHAFLHLKTLGASRQESFQEHHAALTSPDSNDFMISETVRNMQAVIQSCFSFFNSTFSETGRLVNSIKFEATFMTKSYIDHEITIPCSANKENRTPISMLLRNDRPKIFENTETAKIYNMARPSMILIEDTSTTADYAETYSSQKNALNPP